MTWHGSVPDEDSPETEAARIARAEGGARAVLLKALGELIMTRDSDVLARRRLRAADPQWWSAEQQQELERLAWKYRRQLPRHLAPRLNPDDPIVREMRKKEARHG